MLRRCGRPCLPPTQPVLTLSHITSTFKTCKASVNLWHETVGSRAAAQAGQVQLQPPAPGFPQECKRTMSAREKWTLTELIALCRMIKITMSNACYCFAFIEGFKIQVSQIRNYSFWLLPRWWNSGPLRLAYDKIKILRNPCFFFCLALISKDGITDFKNTSIWLLIDCVSDKCNVDEKNRFVLCLSVAIWVLQLSVLSLCKDNVMTRLAMSFHSQLNHILLQVWQENSPDIQPASCIC